MPDSVAELKSWLADAALEELEGALTLQGYTKADRLTSLRAADIRGIAEALQVSLRSAARLKAKLGHECEA